MKRKLLSAVLAASMLALTACGGAGQTQESETSAVQESVTERHRQMHLRKAKKREEILLPEIR